MFPNTKSNDFYTGIVRCSAARTTQRQGAAAANQIARPSTGVDIANSACRYLHAHDPPNNCEITTYPIVGSFCTFSLLYFSPARRWSLIQTQRVGNYSIFTFSSYLAVPLPAPMSIFVSNLTAALCTSVYTLILMPSSTH